MNINYEGKQYDEAGKYIGDLYIVDDIKIYVCYPQSGNLTENVETTFFWPGSSNGSSYIRNSQPYVKKFIENANSNNILISVDYNKEIYTDPNKMSSAINSVNNLMQYIENEKNINLIYSKVESCSAGGVPSLKQFLSVLKSAENGSKSAYKMELNLYDTYSHGQAFFDYEFTDEELKLMKENDVQITYFVRNDTVQSYNRINKVLNPDSQDGKIISSLVGAGISPVLIYGNYQHADILKRVSSDGWLDYQKGLINLEDIKNNEEINYRIRILENGVWTEYKLSDIVGAKLNPQSYGSTSESLLRVYDYLENMYVKVDYELINSIESLEGIWNTNLSRCFIDSSSTSKLLPKENELLLNIYGLIGNMQHLLEIEVKNAIFASNEYMNLEKELNLGVERLRDNINIIEDFNKSSFLDKKDKI